MQHPLDNPAWNALISGNQHLANGEGQVRYFDREVSPFAAFGENTTENFRALYEILPHNGPVLFVTPVEMEIPAPWAVQTTIHGLQMVHDGRDVTQASAEGLVPLTEEHVPQMLSLTKLTNPGPFAARTIDFGSYHGIFEGDKLVAMTGRRMHPFDHLEISAVCTHPDHTGKGYARQLMLHQMNLIRAESKIPFLHVRFDNDRAIKVYKDLGFVTRKEVYFYVMRKGDAA